MKIGGSVEWVARTRVVQNEQVLLRHHFRDTGHHDCESVSVDVQMRDASRTWPGIAQVCPHNPDVGSQNLKRVIA